MSEGLLPGVIQQSTDTSAAVSGGFRAVGAAGAAGATAGGAGTKRRLPPIAKSQPAGGAAAAYHVPAGGSGVDHLGNSSRKRLFSDRRRLEHARASFFSEGSATTEEQLKLVAPKRPLKICRRMVAKANCTLSGSYDQKVSKRLKDQGVSDWWTPLLNGEAYYSSGSGATRHDAAIKELESQLDPQVDVEKAIENLEYRDAVGATVLHAAILTYGASKGVDPRKSERAFAVAEYLIQHFGPRQLVENQQKYRRDPSDPRTGVAIDLVNRAYYMDGVDQQYNGETALHMAIVYSDEKLVRKLLDAGASLSARCYGEFFKPSGPCYFGELPLSFAVSCGNLRIVYMLVDHVRNAPTRLARRVLNEWDRDLRKDELREKLLAGDSMPGSIDSITGSIEFAAVEKPTRTEVIAADLQFSPVTAPTLSKARAQEYCWVPPASMEGAPDGGFLYKFADGSYRLFPCADEDENKQDSKRAVAKFADFPEAMVPLCLAPSASSYRCIQLDLDAQTWEAPQEGSGQVWQGQISRECEITLSSKTRTQAGIPKAADYFVWAYQDHKYNPDEAESESDFLEFGGFVYYRRTDQDITVVGALAPSLKNRHVSAFGARVDQTERTQGLEELVAMGWEKQKAEEILRKCGYMVSYAVSELIRRERQEVREEVTTKIFGEQDADHNGMVSRTEFERWMGDRDKGDTTVMQQKRVFQLLTQVDCLGNTALHMAVIHKRIEIFDWLLSPLTCTGCPRSEPKSIQDMLEENQGMLKALAENKDMPEEQKIAMSTPYLSQVEDEAKQRYDLMKSQEKKLTKRFDSNGDGKVTSREMQKGLAELYETGSSGQSRQARPKHHRGQSDAERWAKTAVDNIDADASGEIGAHEWSKWWWGGWWQKKLLERENSSALTALTLAALAGDEILFCHVLEATRVHKWSYGAVACHEMPLTQLDTLRSFDLPRRIRSPVAMKGDDDYDWKRSAMLIVLSEGVHAIADNKTLVDLQDAKWKKFAGAYFWLSLTLYSGYVSLVWLLSFEFVAYSQASLESSSAGDNVELPAGLRLWEWAVASMTVFGLVGFVFDYIGVMHAKKRQLKTIEQSRSQVKNDLVRAKQNSPLGPYFYDRPIWFSDGRIHAITRDAIGHASKHQAFEHKQLEAYARVTDKWSPDPQKSTSMSEERRYVGPDEFTERLTFHLTNFQVLTIVRTALVMFYDDGQGNWFGMMSLGICAPIVHIQFFEWACGHRNNGHLIIVIERALKKDIKTFLIVLFVFILGFGQALYVLAVDTINDESSGNFARMVRSWLSLFRIATGEKPGWAKQNRDWDLFERSEVWHQDVEQTYIYLIFFMFVIIAAIVLLRLLISMFNETYNDVKKNRERIWRMQRGQFILTCERRLLLLAKIWDFLFFRLTHIKCLGHCNRLCCCVQSYDGTQVRASLGQRLVARMWVGDTIEVVDNVLHRHKVGKILIQGGLELAAEAEVNSPGHQKSLQQRCTVKLREIGVRANIITPESETADLRIRFETEIGKTSEEEMKQRIEGALEPVLGTHHAGRGAERLTVRIQYDSDEPTPRVVSRDELENEAMHIALLKNPHLFRGKEKDVEAERSAIKEALALLTRGEWTIRPGPHSLMLQQEAPPVGAETPSQVRIRQLQARESDRREAKLLGQQPRPV